MLKFTLICALIGTFLTTEADAHGAMSFPATRNTVTSHHCPQCANADGVCGAGSGGQWPADATASAQLNSAYTTPLTKLIAGGRVEIEAFFTAAHQGHFVLEFCQNPGSTITDNCFVRLERDETDTRFGPYASAAPTVGFIPTNQCITQFNTPRNPLRMRFKVPQGATTSHGILRWFWQTGNSCDSSAFNSGSGIPSTVSSWSNQLGSQTCRAATTNLGASCGSDCPSPSCRGEQFRNCADVSVTIGDPSTIVSSGNAETDVGNGNTDGGNGNGNGGATSTTTARVPVTTTTKSNGGGNGGPQGWAAEVGQCRSSVKGIQPWWTPDCQDYCAEAVRDPFYHSWCQVRGIDRLTACVLSLRSAACTQA